jgi:hypothetical protein
MRTFILASIIGTCLLIALAACPSRQQSAAMTDQQLIDAVRKAAGGGATPADVESRVGAPAIINTTRPGDREILRRATVELDPQEQSEISSIEVPDLAYFRRPGTFENPRVVGIAWLAGGSAKVFFAVVYPPE